MNARATLKEVLCIAIIAVSVPFWLLYIVASWFLLSLAWAVTEAGSIATKWLTPSR